MAKKATIKKTEVTVLDNTAAESALDSIKDVFEQPATLEKLVGSAKMKAVFAALKQVVDVDHQSEIQAPIYGEILSKILTLPLDSQKPFVWALADYKGLPRPTYQKEGAGRPTTGRNELATVLYGEYPDMLVTDKGKDTRGAKRITDHVRRFLIKTGQKASGRPALTEGQQGAPVPLRALKVSFKALWEVAQSDVEQRVLVALYMKLGIPPEDLNKWTDQGLLKLAAAPLSAIEAEIKHTS